MSDYTPTTEEVRGRHNANAMLDSRTWKMANAEFDRWFASEIEKAEYRGAVKAGRAIVEQAILDMDTEFGAHL